GGVCRGVAPVHVDRPGVVVHAGVGERAQVEGLGGPLVRALVRRSHDGRGHVVHDHGGRVVRRAVVPVEDPALDRVGTVVGEGAGRRCRGAGARVGARERGGEAVTGGRGVEPRARGGRG